MSRWTGLAPRFNRPSNQSTGLLVPLSQPDERRRSAMTLVNR